MTTDIMVERHGDTLVPVAEQFREALHGFPEKRQLVITVRLAEDKSDAMRAWLWALVHNLIDAGCWDGDAESLMDHLKIQAGYFSTIVGAPTFGEETIRLAEESLRKDTDKLHKLLAKAIIEAGPRLHYVPRSISRGSISASNLSRLINRIELYVGEKWAINPEQWRTSRREPLPVASGMPEAPAQPAEPESPPGSSMEVSSIVMMEALNAMGFELGFAAADGLVPFENYWQKAKETKRVRELHKRFPDAVKKLHDLAGRKANGEVEALDFDEQVRFISRKATILL